MADTYSYSYVSTAAYGGKNPIATDARLGFSWTAMIGVVENAMADAKAKLSAIQLAGSTVSISSMFDMQMLMNRLSQYSEMSTSMIAAANTSIMSMSRNVKG